jgi:hypothetical protein
VEERELLGALDVARSLGAAPAPPERHGPAVVAIGGGHGLSATLRAARRYAGPITAVVSVADDGGSSGRIRHLLPDMPAPGDLRKCLGALADEGPRTVASSSTASARGSWPGTPSATCSSCRSRWSWGRSVRPSTRWPPGWGRWAGSSPPRWSRWPWSPSAARRARWWGRWRCRTPGVERLRVDPADAPSPPAVASAIAAADQVVIGPGSLFTSVLAAAVPPEVLRCPGVDLRAAGVHRQPRPAGPGDRGFTVADEVAALWPPRHRGRRGGGRRGPACTAGVAPAVHHAQLRADDAPVHDPDRLGEVLGCITT